MEFFGELDEYLLITSNTHKDKSLVNKDNESLLSVFWNQKNEKQLTIDSVSYIIKPNQMVFLTELHHIDVSKVDEINLIKFNRNFYCIDNHNIEIGCKGALFFGASQVPIINLNEENAKKIELLWSVFNTEMKCKDELQLEMLKMLLKRLLILSIRIFKEEHKILHLQETKIDVIRNFIFLVEVHFKKIHTVGEYADLMNKPAKSLTNLFANHIKRSPLQIIQDRIFIEAKRILRNSEKTIKETAFELGFDDIQSFSRFFKKKLGVSPKEFRKTL